jgi:hypothetical protein
MDSLFYDPYPGFKPFPASRRVQRQIHGGPDGVARRLQRHAARTYSRHYTQLLPAAGALAIFRNPFGKGL